MIAERDWREVIEGEIVLSWPEARRAVMVGAERKLRALKNGRAYSFDLRTIGFDEDCVGAMGEMCVAKRLNVYWEPSLAPDKFQGDVAGHGVRTTLYPQGHLIIHEDDPDEQAMILVRLISWQPSPRFEVAGWLCAADGKRDEFWRAANVRHPCFMVPGSALNHLVTLQ